jgi:hypothetical protein
MNLLSLVTICIVIIVYVHVMFQLKTSNDLEVYEIQLPPKPKLEEVCNFKQPVLFDYDDMKCTPEILKEYSAFDVLVYDSSYIPVPLTLEKAEELFKTKNYATFNNSDFLQETMAKRHYETTDGILRPPLVCSITYDLLFGSPDYTTQLQYKTSYRNYFLVTRGTITVKLAPPRSTVFLNEIKKFETQEFYSPLNPWTEPDKKVKFLDIVVPTGKLLFIPAYWWYSIRLEKDACVCIFHYKTIMNIIATLPDIGLGILQRHNTTMKLLPSYSLHTNLSLPDGSRT